jgi:putative tryptophan/tyrosine transport system substrate-binding protein
MKRREFIALLGGATIARPRAAPAQPPGKIPRIGVIDESEFWDHFRRGLQAYGYIEGRNITLDLRKGEERPEGLAAAAAELAGIPVDVIATWGTPASRAAQQATSRIPIVAIAVGDPVRTGLVASLARPGGNITGNTILASDVVAKRLQLLKELIPHVNRLGFLWNPDNESNIAQVEQLKATLPKFGMSLISVEARSSTDLDGALAAMMRERPDAFQMTNDPSHRKNLERVVRLVDQSGLPGMYQTRDAVAAGGLISYGPDLPDLFLRGAGYVHRILQGAKPADLPIEQPITFELAVNLKTAQALSINVPLSLLALANEVID